MEWYCVVGKAVVEACRGMVLCGRCDMCRGMSWYRVVRGHGIGCVVGVRSRVECIRRVSSRSFVVAAV